MSATQTHTRAVTHRGTVLAWPRATCMAAAVLLFGGLCVAAAARARVKHTGSLEKLSFRDLAGQKQSLSAYRGQIVIVNFWATWCKPCREELPMLNELAGEYGDKGVTFVAVSVDEKKAWSQIPDFVKREKITMHVLVGANAGTVAKLKLGNEVPATVIFDTDGEPVGRILGEARRSDIVSWLDWLRGSRTGPKPPAEVKHL